MDFKKVNTYVKQADKAEQLLSDACERIAKEMQPHFHEELAAHYAPSDGVVLAYENPNDGIPLNESISEVLLNLKQNVNYYKP